MQLIREYDEKYQIKDIGCIDKYVNEFRNEDREHFIVLGLDSGNRLTYRDVISIGTMNSTLISPALVFKKAIINSSNSIILVHNHPSGNTKPSNEDIAVHRKLKRAGELLGIKVVDCVIITKDNMISFDDEIERI